MMDDGLSAQDALDRLLQDDPDRELRQAGVVDAKGRAASFTGQGCFEWAGSLAGNGYAIQGNILKGARVVKAMERTFLNTRGSLPHRLYRALRDGDRAGGDRRGRQSAAILVVKRGAGYAGFNDRWLDYRVDDHEDPVTQLGELLEIHELYFGKSPEDDRLFLKGRSLLRIRMLLQNLGYLHEEASAKYDEITREALAAFLGNENFEERADIAAGWIDRPVWKYILRKYEMTDAEKH
jgi:uncharacterized Ntn-hydrolase superfamily protein